MARKRMIDPEFWSDEEIGGWCYESRLFYIGLWNFSDDAGRFKAHDSLLRSQIFPYDKDVDISGLKTELSNKVKWYQVNGLQYGFLRNFSKHQRIDKPTLSKLPPPPEGFDDNSPSNLGTLGEGSRKSPPNISKEKLSKEKRSKENITHTPLTGVSECEVKKPLDNGDLTVKEPTSLKDKYLDFVYLSTDEYEKLLKRWGAEVVDMWIARLNDYIGSKGKKYKSHYHTILVWADKDKPKHRFIPTQAQVNSMINLERFDKKLDMVEVANG